MIKYLLPLLSILLVGCGIKADQYKAGEQVTVQSGFYKGCTGVIRDANVYSYVLMNVQCRNLIYKYSIEIAAEFIH